MSKLVTIFGGAGFVGRYIVRRMVKQGWRVRVACRRPNEALFVKPYGYPGQVEPVFCNIRDDASVRAVTRGVDAVVNCVGTFNRLGRNNMIAVQAEGAGRIARIAAEEGVEALVHLSAIGADAEGPSKYCRTKAAGEKAVLEAFPGAVILRPSAIFGPEDGFFNKFAGMATVLPILPLAKGATKIQAVYVDDVAQAAVKGALGQAPAGIYELGGPETDSLKGLVHRMLGVIQRRRLVLPVPVFAMKIVAFFADMVEMGTLGLVTNRLLTRDQLNTLGPDNVVAAGAKGLADLGIVPTPMEGILPEYLWRFRPSGQFAAIKASAKNLKKA